MVQVANYELLNECQWEKKYPKEGIMREKEGTDSERIRTQDFRVGVTYEA